MGYIGHLSGAINLELLGKKFRIFQNQWAMQCKA